MAASSTVRVPLPAGAGGGHLDLWLIPGDRDRVAIIGHGLGLNRAASLHHAKMLHDAGFTVYVFDHRNHGTSSHSRAVRHLGRMFTDDAVAVVNHVRSTPDLSAAKIMVYGFSFSTFPMYSLLGRDDCDVDAIVCDSGPALSIPPLFANFVRASGLPVPSPLRIPPACRAFEPVFVQLSTAMLGREWPPAVNQPYACPPVLFLAGEQDRIIPPAAVAELAGRYPNATLQILPGVEHLKGLKTSPSGYRRAVLDFLDKALR